jgi:MFS family permease
VRRLLVFISVVVFVDTMLFGVMIPLLPGFAAAYGLSKLESGLLFGAYGAGAVLGGVPGGVIASRVGPKRAVLAGLAVLAFASFGFAFAGSPLSLGVARFVQGLSSTMTWAGALAWVTIESPRSRRGQTLGIIFGCAVAGSITGPMFGALARSISIEVSFALIGAVSLALAGAAAVQPQARREAVASAGLATAFGDRAFVAGLWLVMLPAFFFGVLDLLAPLALDDAGYGAFAIGTVFVVAGVAEMAVGPFAGRVSDRRGRALPIQVSLACGVVTAALLALVSTPVALMILAVAAAVSFGSIYTPGMALVSDRAEASGVAMALGFGVMNTAWAIGVVLGPMIGGGLAEAFGDPIPYVLCAGLAAATLVALGSRRRLRATRTA